MVDSWEGRGLPPVAQRRIARAAADGVRTSMVAVNGAAGLEVAGFDIVGDVLGTTVMQIAGPGYCGSAPRPARRFGGPRRVSTLPYADALRRGRATALNRLMIEATGLRADGVVGIRLTDELVDGGKHEFMALGTAVRARSATRPARPFTTDLGGQDVAKLLLAGWVPVGLTYGISVGVRHIGRDVRAQTRWFAGNTEVRAYTRLITWVRADARRDFTRSAATLGGDCALLSSMYLHARRLEVAESHTDLVAECVITGNTIARFAATSLRPATSLTILPLRSVR
jgi:uncharacterized protein YbjQ (UPF0145 family)